MDELLAAYVPDWKLPEQFEVKARLTLAAGGAVILTQRPIALWAERSGADLAEVLREAGVKQYTECIYPHESALSAFHAILQREGNGLRVRCRAYPKPPTNPTWFGGEKMAEFVLADREWFAVGQTRFTFSLAPVLPAATHTMGIEEAVKESRKPNADRRLQVAMTVIRLIQGGTSEEPPEAVVVRSLLNNIPNARRAALVRLLPDSTPKDVSVQVLRSEWRPPAPLKDIPPSRALVWKAVRAMQIEYFSFDRSPRGSVLSDSSSVYPITSLSTEVAWAICAPINDSRSLDMALYVEGDSEVAPDRASDQAFVGLIAAMLGTVLKQRRDEDWLRAFQRFLPQEFLRASMSRPISKLTEPQEAEAAVMYFDIRGSSKLAEADQAQIPKVLNEVCSMLGDMTNAVNAQRGCVIDFMGDGALACWGWPVAQADRAEQAAAAALNTVAAFAYRRKPNESLPACGIGLTLGKVYAGGLGPPAQQKLSLFGHPVNLAARLQSMTKAFGVPILIDEEFACGLAKASEPDWWRTARHSDRWRIRPVARVRPVGMQSAMILSELLPDAAIDPKRTSDVELRQYNAFLERFIDGKWRDLPEVREDGPTRLIRDYVRAWGPKPPADWVANGGVIDMNELRPGAGG